MHFKGVYKMGCSPAMPMKITIKPNLTRTSIEALDSLYSLVERTVEKVNKVNSSLSVALDKFQTVAGLHNPPRSVACGVLAMLACISAVVEGELLRIDFHIFDSVPGFGLNEALLPPELGNVYLIWIALAREVEASLIDMNEIMPDFLDAVKTFKQISAQTDEIITDSSGNILEVKKIHECNMERLQESSEFFGEVLKKSTSAMKELASIHRALNRVEVVAEFIRLGEHANKLCIFWPEELMQTFGPTIERFVEKVFTSA